jgi:hypothetical protein
MKSKSINFNSLKQEIFEENNKIRANPQSYIPILENHLKYFKGDVFMKPGEIGIQTNEGKPAVQEAINFLKKAKALGNVELNDNLCRAVQDHVNDIGPKGETGHQGSDGSSPSDRVERYCVWEGGVCENIDFGSKNGVDVILSLLIDDGVASRGHRKNLFNEKVKYVGIAVGTHTEYEIVSTCVYCEGISGKSSAKSNTNSKVANNKNNVNVNPAKDIGINDQGKDKIKGLFDKFDKKIPTKEEMKNNDEEYDMDNDPDFPEGAVSVDIKIKDKVEKGKKIRITTKIYTMEDGSKETVEVQSFSK